MRRTQDIRTSHAPRRARMHARLCTIRACICMRPPVVGIAPAPFWGPRPKLRFWVPGAVGRSDDGHWPFAAFREPHHHNLREGSLRRKVFSDVYSDMIMVNTTPRNWVGFVRVFALAEGDHSTLPAIHPLSPPGGGRGAPRSWGPRPKLRFWVPGAVGRSDDGHWPFAAFREPHHHNLREGSLRRKVFSDVYSDMIMVNTTPRDRVGFVRVFALAEGDHSTLGTFYFFFG